MTDDTAGDKPEIPDDEQVMLLVAIGEILDGMPGQGARDLIN